MTQEECEHELDEALRDRENTLRDRMIRQIKETNIHNSMCARVRAGGESIFFEMPADATHAEDEANISLVRSKIANQGMTHRYQVEKCIIGDICVSLVKKNGRTKKRVRSRFDTIEEQLEKHEDMLNALIHHPLVGSEMKLARKRFEEWKSREGILKR